VLLGEPRLPDQEDPAEADEGDRLACLQPGVFGEPLVQHDPPLGIRSGGLGVGEESDGQIVVLVGEGVELVEPARELAERGLGPGLDAGPFVARAEHQFGRVEAGESRAERRWNRDPALAVQPVRMGAQELAHPVRAALSSMPGGTGPPRMRVPGPWGGGNGGPRRRRAMVRNGISWSIMGVNGNKPDCLGISGVCLGRGQ
jgi:hypothetical protein